MTDKGSRLYKVIKGVHKLTVLLLKRRSSVKVCEQEC